MPKAYKLRRKIWGCDRQHIGVVILKKKQGHDLTINDLNIENLEYNMFQASKSEISTTKNMLQP